MRKTAHVGLLAGALALSACGTMNPNPTTENQVDQIIAITMQVCKFVPTAATVAALLGQPGFVSALEIANGICGAVKAPSQLRRGAVVQPSYRGVRIEGRFIR